MTAQKRSRAAAQCHSAQRIVNALFCHEQVGIGELRYVTEHVQLRVRLDHQHVVLQLRHLLFRGSAFGAQPMQREFGFEHDSRALDNPSK
ncbi:hypothetical protein ACFKHW_21240 [Bradyrhizobium lupini]|uniref:hypothetical protein n=1 Tax=Rhizobium lupini TaxID=136996 RepID=UPI0036722E92